MKNYCCVLRSLFTCFCIVVALQFNAEAQIAVTVTNPTSTSPNLAASYPSLASAISALNNIISISAPVTLTCASGGSETAPAAGFDVHFTAATTATNNVVFEGSGCTLTAFTPQASGILYDAVFKILGSDYVTVQNFIMQENSANTTATANINNMTEWGVALLYLSNTNGAQYCTIQNNTISLNRNYQNTFGIYSNSSHSPTVVTSNNISSGAAGNNSGLKIYSNNVSNVNNGIMIVGPNSSISPNTGIDVGGSSAATANTISNYGRTTTFTTYASAPNTLAGVTIRNCINVNVSNNNITSSSGGTTLGSLYGVYFSTTASPSGAFADTINNNYISLITGQASGSITGILLQSGSGSSASNLFVNNNNFENWNNFGASPTGSMTFIDDGTTNLNTTINGNTFTNINVPTTGSVTFINCAHSVPANGTQNVTNNSITTAFNKTGSGGTVTGITSNSSATTTSLNWSNNNFSNITVTGSTAVTGILNFVSGSVNHLIQNNTINNINAGSGAVIFISVNSGGSNGNGGSQITNNTLTNVTSTGAITAISIGASGNTGNIASNIMSGYFTTGASAIIGITSSYTTGTISKNKICDLQSNNAAGTVTGINIAAGSLHTVVNNIIGDLRTPSANAANPLIGLNIGSSAFAVNAYYNTISLSGLSSGVNFGSSAVNSSISPNVELRNNIIYNASVKSGTGLTVAYRRTSSTLTGYVSSSNNNLFYAGTPSASNLIFYDGSNSDQTLEAFKSRVSPRDAASVTENLSSTPTYKSSACNNVDFLHIKTNVATQVETGAVPVAGITDDFDGDTRNNTASDIGADELNGTSLDLLPPVITYTPIGFTCATGLINRTITVTITDVTGVADTGSLIPRIYFKKNFNGVLSSSGGSLVSGTGINGTWNFTISTNVSVGDSIYYFIIAQDLASTPNISSNPSAGLVASNVNSVSTPPSSLPSFRIAKTLNGDYTVGTGGNYTTLTGAIAEYNASCMSGPVRFLLTNASYSETFPIIINLNVDANSTNTLTIQPASTNPGTTIISGSSATSIIKLNGAKYIIINGSKNNTTSRDLIITNTNNANATAAAWLMSAGVGAGSSDNTIKNCSLSCGIDQSTTTGETMAIYCGGQTIGSTTNTSGNNNNTFNNNSITRVSWGIFITGSAAGINTGNTITGNIIGPAAFGSDEIGRAGIYISYQDNAVVTLNEVRFVGKIFGQSTSLNDCNGIGIGGYDIPSFGTPVTNTTVSRNKIHDIINEKTFSAAGMILGNSAAAASNNIISNNIIYNVRANGTSGDKGVGLFIEACNGDKVVYNSVNMSDMDIDPSGTTSATESCMGIRVQSTATNLFLKNNISKVNLTSNTSSLKHFSITIGTSTHAWGTGGCDNNCYYVNTSNSQNVLAGYGTTTITQLSSLGAWQALFSQSQDHNSVSGDPRFISATDLHIDPALFTLVEKGAAPVTGITIDYDNQTRDTVRPDIGADEGNFIGNIYEDIAAYAFVTPLDSGNSSAGVALLPFVKFINNSVISHSNVPLRLVVTGPSPSTATVYDEIVTVNFNVGDTLKVQFPLQTIASPGLYSMKAIALYNGDINHNNDTIKGIFTVHDPMHGDYTVDNNIMTSTGNYHSLTAALNDLALRGANAPVRFQIIDSIWYNDPGTINIKPYLGASATNTCTIKDSIGNAVIYSHSLFFMNAAYYIIDGLDLSDGTVWLRNSSTYNTIKNCSFTKGCYVSFHTTDTGSIGNNNNLIINNVFDYGTITSNYPDYAIVNIASSTADNTENKVIGNTIAGFRTAAIWDQGYSRNNSYINNHIYQTVSQNRELYGIYLRSYYINGATITGNYIHDLLSTTATGSFGGAGGILTNGLGHNADFLIANNMISIAATTSSGIRGIDISGDGRYKIYNNTVNITGTGNGNSYALFIGNFVDSMNCKNNLLVNTRVTLNCGSCKNYAISNKGYLPYIASDYNDIYNAPSSSNVFGYNSNADVASLAAWQSVTGKDANSFTVAPVFTSPTNLHLIPASNTALANKALSVPEVTDDFDEQIRNGCPDIGADEFDFTGSYYADADSDGYGSSAMIATPYCTNNPPAGYVSDNTDCNDANNAIYPNAIELCYNGVDENCNALIDDGCILNLNLSFIIEGYYIGSGLMNAALYNNGLTNDSTICDTVIVELYHATNYTLTNTVNAVLKTNGLCTVSFPPGVIGSSYYIAVKQRNGMQTWSKNPVYFNNATMNFSFITH